MKNTWIGILGAGQLGERLALAGYPLGLRFRVLDPKPDASAGHLAPHIVAGFDDPDALRQLVDGVSCVTIETESVPVSTLELLEAEGVPVLPGPRSLRVSADRLREKEWLGRLGIATAPYEALTDRDQAAEALVRLGGRGILKTRTLGYDGKGQERLRSTDDLDAAWERLGNRPLILEQELSFQRELSLVSVRSRSGEIRHYPLVENRHEDGVLRETIAPTDVDAAVTEQARAWSETMLRRLEHVGVLTIELFQTDDGLIVNELAPRVHNSGHWSIEGAVCSQFENHLRAILDWPLRSTEPIARTRMVNLIGELPEAHDLLGKEDARLHVYRKEARPGRKLGHVTLLEGPAPRVGSEPAGEGGVADTGRAADTAPASAGSLSEAPGVASGIPPTVSRRQLARMMAGGAAALVASTLPTRAGADTVPPSTGAGRTTATPGTGSRYTGAPWASRRQATPEEALERLREGNARFVAGRPDALNRDLGRVSSLSGGQEPFAAILGCADSRVPPELLFDQGFGDLFVVRVAGNVATPEEIASLEYAVGVLGASLILVLGHTSCGAVTAALDGGAAPGQISSLYQHMYPALDQADGDVQRAVELNVGQQAAVVRGASPVIRDLSREGAVAVEGGVYDLASGRVRLLGMGDR